MDEKQFEERVNKWIEIAKEVMKGAFEGYNETTAHLK